MAYTEGLYDRGYLINFGDGEVVVYRTNIDYRSSVGDTYHVVNYGEDLYMIARKYYGYSSAWFLISDVNDIIDDIFDLPVGETILIPSISAIQSNYA